MWGSEYRQFELWKQTGQIRSPFANGWAVHTT